jgi:hypothetical protein
VLATELSSIVFPTEFQLPLSPDMVASGLKLNPMKCRYVFSASMLSFPLSVCYSPALAMRCCHMCRFHVTILFACLCRVMSSKKLPLWLVFTSSRDPTATHTVRKYVQHSRHDFNFYVHGFVETFPFRFHTGSQMSCSSCII